MDGPDSSYSCFEIHICWKVESDERMEPPTANECSDNKNQSARGTQGPTGRATGKRQDWDLDNASP